MGGQGRWGAMRPAARWCALIGFVMGSLAPSGALADSFETFYLDPSRSTMQFESGDIRAQLSLTQFAFADLFPQPGVAPAPLSGQFVLQLGGSDPANPTSFDVLAGTSDIRPADSNTVSPGAGGAPGTTDAAFGLMFFDSTTGIGGEVALHDLVFGISGSLFPVANGLGPLGIAGSLPWIAGAGAMEIGTNLGIGGSAFVPFTMSSSGSVDSTASQFSELAPGIFEVVIPYTFLIGIVQPDGPLGVDLVRATFSGEIVATNVIPEPGTGALLALGLTCLAARRRQRSSR